jgi:hypothetical protein
MLMYDNVIENIKKAILYDRIMVNLKQVEGSIYDPIDDNNPNVDDTLSGLIFKLSCVTNQM